MKQLLQMATVKVLVRGGGDLASGVAWRLHQSGFRVVITEIPEPLSVRRKVAFSEAVYEGQCVVEGVQAVLVTGPEEVARVWNQGFIPVLVDPEARCRHSIKPEVIVDAILAKKNLGTSAKDAPLVVALGPGFEAGKDAHFVVETQRGHNLGRLLASGSAAPNTGVPGAVQGITSDRVLRAPASGPWRNVVDIGDMVKKGDAVGTVQGETLYAPIDGVLRGLIRPGITVSKGLKIGHFVLMTLIARGKRDFCFTISEKALAIAGGVLELAIHQRPWRPTAAIAQLLIPIPRTLRRNLCTKPSYQPTEAERWCLFCIPWAKFESTNAVKLHALLDLQSNIPPSSSSPTPKCTMSICSIRSFPGGLPHFMELRNGPAYVLISGSRTRWPRAKARGTARGEAVPAESRAARRSGRASPVRNSLK